MIAYKLFRKRKDGALGPLFINQRQVVPLNQWLDAECHPTKGYAVRPGWHCCAQPSAPHLSREGRVWAAVIMLGWEEHHRPHAQGDRWFIAKQLLVRCLLPPRCPFCNEVESIRFLLADEPWHPKILACPSCNSTYNIGEFDK